MVFGVVRYRLVNETGKEDFPRGPSQQELFEGRPTQTSSVNR
jgi:hypothetical protein